MANDQQKWLSVEGGIVTGINLADDDTARAFGWLRYYDGAEKGQPYEPNKMLIETIEAQSAQITDLQAMSVDTEIALIMLELGI